MCQPQKLTLQSSLGLVPVETAQQSIWAGPHRERGVLRLTPGHRVGAKRTSQERRPGPALWQLGHRGIWGTLKTIESARTGISRAQNSITPRSSPPGICLGHSPPKSWPICWDQDSSGQPGGTSIPILSKACLGVRRPSCGLVVWPWIGTLSSLSLSFPNCT